MAARGLLGTRHLQGNQQCQAFTGVHPHCSPLEGRLGCQKTIVNLTSGLLQKVYGKHYPWFKIFSFVCVHISVRGYIFTCRSKDNTQVPFLMHCPSQCFFGLSLAWDSQSRLGQLASEPQGSTCLYLPFTGFISRHLQIWLFNVRRLETDLRVSCWQGKMLSDHVISLTPIQNIIYIYIHINICIFYIQINK